MMFVNAFPGCSVPDLSAEELTSRSNLYSASRKETIADLPDPQIIRNILNYARSLEVMKPATGAAMFLINN